MHPRVQQALLAGGATYQVRKHADCPQPIRSPQDFAACLGYDLARITKTLFCRSKARDQYALVVASMSVKIDFPAVARLLACPRVEVADKADLKSRLGYPPQGVSPLGVSDYSIFVDEGLMQFPTILVGGGTTGIEIELAPDTLVALCAGQVKPLSQGAGNDQ